MRSCTSWRAATLVAFFALLIVPASSWSADDPPGMAVDHSGEHFTLDGLPAAADVAGAAGHTCAVSPDASGTVACFTTRSGYGRAAAEALRRGQLPPGWFALPPGLDRLRLIQQLEQLPDTVSPTVAGTARRLRLHRTTHRLGPVARAADGYSCNRTLTDVWTDASFGGTGGTQGYTGVDSWRNYSSTFDNRVSSFWNEAQWTSRWHDYANGQGAYYGNGYACRYVENLQNASMTDGGTANDRFSSWADW